MLIRLRMRDVIGGCRLCMLLERELWRWQDALGKSDSCRYLKEIRISNVILNPRLFSPIVAIIEL